MEKKTGNLGCFVCPLPVFFSLNYQLFLATLPKISVSLLYSQKYNLILTLSPRYLKQLVLSRDR